MSLHYNYSVTNHRGIKLREGIFTLNIPNAILEVEVLDTIQSHFEFNDMDIININGPYNCRRKFIYDKSSNKLVDVLDLIKISYDGGGIIDIRKDIE